MIRAYPKVFSLGTDYIKDIYQGEIEISEKLDGSQLSFSKIDGELFIRSKGQQIFPESVDKLFKNAVDYILSIEDKLPNDIIFYTEYFSKPRHNLLKYDRIPRNHLALFGVCDKTGTKFESKYFDLEKYAKIIDIEPISLIWEGNGDEMSIEKIMKFLEMDSMLGGAKIEGVVVKNYGQPFLLGGQPIPLMAGKFVSEKFKEVNQKSWGKEKTSKGKWQTFKESYKTEARWQKAIQHLKENGELKNDSCDIGKLIVEIKKDIGQEEKENIKEFLWKEFGEELLRYSTVGFPEFYKEFLLKKSLNTK